MLAVDAQEDVVALPSPTWNDPRQLWSPTGRADEAVPSTILECSALRGSHLCPFHLLP